MRTIDELVRLHKETVNAKDLARIEAELYVIAPVPRTPQSGILAWLADRLSISQFTLQGRRSVLICGPGADDLWERIDHGFPLASAKRVLSAARAKASPRHVESFRRAVAEELERLYPTAVAPPNVEDESEAAAESEPPESKPDLTGVSSLAPREFWLRMRQVVMEHVRARVELPEHERETLLDEFERDVQSVFAQHNTRWQKLARTIQERKRVSRSRFVNALRTLHMDPPRRNAPLEPVLSMANKQKKTLARLYHPDVHRGTDSTVDQYQAVLEAYEIVRQYIEENNRPQERPPLRLVSDNGSK